MSNERIVLNPNKLVTFLNKPAADFTRRDIVNFIERNDIRMLNFRYVGGDGKLKLLNFIINDKKYLEKILSVGERVDGSSLFRYIEPSSSDLYVVPRYKTAFVNPFSDVPAVDILCSYYDKNGEPLNIAPENIIKKAHAELKKSSGMELEAMGELEFYISSELDKIYTIMPQKGYHESHPFAKWQLVRIEAMKLISEMGGRIKYGHSEVGNIDADGDWEYVQHEIEFLPVNIEDAADQLVVAKWALREVAYKYGLEVIFAPKIIVGHAGSGLHIHSRLVKDGKNMMVDDNGELNDTAKKMIGGLLELAPSLTAFGNVVPTSFLRLVPHQEAPTSICWGNSNRSVLVRVPLGWKGVNNMILDANPKEKEVFKDPMNNQTVELRSPDGSANVYQLLAGITVAARIGLESPTSLEKAQKLYVKGDVGKNHGMNLPQLPDSCHEAGEQLLKDRDYYEKCGIFPAAMIDGIVSHLKKYDDKNLSEKLFGDGDALAKLVKQYLHCG